MSYFDILAARAGVGGDAPTPQPVLIEKSVTQNGTYSAQDDEADGFRSVSVDVPNSYAAGDEGKVVSNGALVAQSSSSTSSNGTVDTTLIDSLAISVPTYSAADNGKVVQNGELVAQSTHKPITANATGIDTTNYSSVDVAVQKSYAAGDDGKVVQNGVLVAQTSTSVSQNGTIDTTTNNSVTVNVANSYTQADEGKVVSNGALVAQTTYPSEITINNTYDTTNYNSVTVNVSSAGGANKLTFTSSMRGSTVTTNELYSINSDSSTSVFGYFVFKTPANGSNDSFTFSFDSAFTPAFTSAKVTATSSSITSLSYTYPTDITNGYKISIGNLYANRTYTIYIQTLCV